MITRDSSDELYTVAEAAAALRVSKPTIWRWIRSGRLPVRRLGERIVRIRRRDVSRLDVEAGAPVSVAPHADLASYMLPRPPREVSEDELLRELAEINADILARNGNKQLSSSLPLMHEQRR